MQKHIEEAVAEIGKVILGKEHQVRLALACLFAKGHLLIEDLPGMGKTMLSHALAKALGLSYNRIQFTSDLLPADVLGFSVYVKDTGQFHYHSGPIFAQVILADEINRATPKAQSALLEAMEERQVTVEGKTRKLPEPFFVIATQNPATQAGTYPLPESQLDRFLMRIVLGYPDPTAERLLLKGNDRHEMIEGITRCINDEQLKAIQQEVTKVNATDTLLDYVQKIVEFTRNTPEIAFGLSPRASMALLRSAQSWAYLEGRNHVIPEDVQAVLPSVVEHRVRGYIQDGGGGTSSISQLLLSKVDVIDS
ncbi:MAG: AAA family ATPase [Nitrospinae bacterium]|nr:AAA family ATPase [Nitrospinota bacterium]